jgi:hypothetical protein
MPPFLFVRELYIPPLSIFRERVNACASAELPGSTRFIFRASRFPDMGRGRPARL